MAHHPYPWAPGDDPPIIEAHSLTKHEVLTRYLERYVEILTANPSIDRFRILLVDGFAGGGLYRRHDNRALHEGSPLILMRTMERAEIAAQRRRTKKSFKLDVKYIFVEKNKSVIDFLRETLRARIADPLRDDRIQLVHGSFEDQLDSIIREIGPKSRRRRTIFLLDQYGYVEATMRGVRRVFEALDNAEVILTFAVDWLIDYIHDSPRFCATLKKAGLDLDPAALRATLDQDPLLGYARVQRILHAEIFAQSGATYYTPFFIKSPKANRAYWLLHLSARSRARDAMAELHWKMQNTFMHFGGAGLSMLGYDPHEDASLTRQRAFSFDEDARCRTLTSLREDLVTRIYAKPDGERFDALFDATCNGTPATDGLMREALTAIVRDGELVVQAGKRARRPGVVVHEDDLIVRPAQRIFTFPTRR